MNFQNTTESSDAVELSKFIKYGKKMKKKNLVQLSFLSHFSIMGMKCEYLNYLNFGYLNQVFGYYLLIFPPHH